MLRLLFILLWTSVFSLSAQEISQSVETKLSGKYDDYELLGVNDLGVVLHHYGKSNHLLELYNSNLRSIGSKVINLKEKRSYLEQIILGKSKVLVFYSKIEKGQQFLKVRKMNARLDLPLDGVKIDSFARSPLDATKNYYVKASDNKERFMSFYIDRAEGKFVVKFTVYNDALRPILRSSILIEDSQRGLVLKTVKLTNKGNVAALFAHNNRRNESDDFSAEEYTLVLHNIDSRTTTTHVLGGEEDYRTKQPLLEIDEEKQEVSIVYLYQKTRDSQDIGMMTERFDFKNKRIFNCRIPYKEEDFDQSHSYSFRNWEEKAAIIRPRRILSRSDGGIIVTTESQYQFTTAIRTSPPGFQSSIGDDYITYNNKLFFYDIVVYSINPDGTLDWKKSLPKIQETEDDAGVFSSYFMFTANNVLKFLFNEDIYSNGNFMEYNVNPIGQLNRISLLNSSNLDVALIPRKGLQVSGTEVIIPSEKRKNVQLVKIAY